MPNRTKIFLTEAKLKQYSYQIKGKIISKQLVIQDLMLLMVNRSTLEKKEVPCTIINKTKEYSIFQSNIDCSQIFYDVNVNYEQIFDLYVCEASSEEMFKVGNPTFWIKHLIKDTYFKITDRYVTVTPHFTFKRSNLAFKINAINADDFRYLKKLMTFSWLLRLMSRHKNIWLVGELDYKAQDNGMHFYNYMRDRYPEKNVFYVIQKDSRERSNLIDKDNVIDFYSKKHFLYTLVANRVITTHHPDYIYPTQLRKYKKRVKGVKVFLTHGILGVKNMYKNYGNFVNGFKVDHITANSELEKNNMIKDLKYREEQITVTGMPRLDNLFKNNSISTKGILIMPTWRDWLLTEDKFITSEFYMRFKELVTNDNIKKIMEGYHCNITLSLHPNFRRYTHYFENDNVRLVFQGEENIQNLIQSHTLMITDYSSVAFDFSFLKKPVIFYLFDLDRFVGKSSPHLKIPEDLPGACVYELDDLIDALKHYLVKGFAIDTTQMDNKLIKYYDQNSSERVYQACKRARKSKDRMKDNLLVNIFRVIKTKLKNN